MGSLNTCYSLSLPLWGSLTPRLLLTDSLLILAEERQQWALLLTLPSTCVAQRVPMGECCLSEFLVLQALTWSWHEGYTLASHQGDFTELKQALHVSLQPILRIIMDFSMGLWKDRVMASDHPDTVIIWLRKDPGWVHTPKLITDSKTAHTTSEQTQGWW